MAAKPKLRTRDPQATQRRILAAAKGEFARKGLAGARVDDIAARARVNKRMMYHYFGNKEELFRLVIEQAYADIRAAETALELDKLEPVPALKANVAFTWNYYLDNPEFLTLMNSENLHKATHLKNSAAIGDTSRPFVARMTQLLARGAASGDFRQGLDPAQVSITIAAIGYYYLTNRFTGTIVFERDLMSPKALAERLDFNITTILRLVCTPAAMSQLEARS